MGVGLQDTIDRHGKKWRQDTIDRHVGGGSGTCRGVCVTCWGDGVRHANAEGWDILGGRSGACWCGWVWVEARDMFREEVGHVGDGM